MACRRKVGSTDEQIAQLIKVKAWRYAKHPALQEWTRDDLAQEMRMVWHLRRLEFEPSRGDIVVFADVVFNNLLLNLIAAQEAEKRDYHLCTQSLDDPVEDTEDTGTTRHEVYSPESHFNALGGRHSGRGQQADMEIDVARALRDLPPRQMELAVRLAKQSLAEAARAMGISRQTATVWKGQIREVCAAAGLLDYLPGGRIERSKKTSQTA